MTPIQHFEVVWRRCDQLSTLHGYVSRNVLAVLSPDELLRAEWVIRVSALDLYVHELIAQKMRSVFEGARLPSPGYQSFQITNEASHRIRSAATESDAATAFELYVREKLGRNTYQYPDDIADGIRLCSTAELWNEIAMTLGATSSTKTAQAKSLKIDLSLIVTRRNKIAHEGDLQPTALREPWPISAADLLFVATKIEDVVRAIDSII